MRVRIISFGSNWWAMHSKDKEDPFCFRRRAAYFNAAALYSGRRLHHSAIYPGQVRFNQTSGFNPEFPARAIGRTFVSSGPQNHAGKTHLLFTAPADKCNPDAYLVTVNGVEHGVVPFTRPGWRSQGVQPISVSLRGERFEAMLLMGISDWIESSLGRWQISADGRRLVLFCVEEGVA